MRHGYRKAPRCVLLPLRDQRGALRPAPTRDRPVAVDLDKKFQRVMSSRQLPPGTDALPLKLDELCQKLCLYGIQDRVGYTLLA